MTVALIGIGCGSGRVTTTLWYLVRVRVRVKVRVRVRIRVRVRLDDALAPLRVAGGLADARHPCEPRHGAHHVRVAQPVVVHRRQVARLRVRVRVRVRVSVRVRVRARARDRAGRVAPGRCGRAARTCAWAAW